MITIIIIRHVFVVFTNLGWGIAITLLFTPIIIGMTHFILDQASTGVHHSALAGDTIHFIVAGDTLVGV